MAKVKKVGENSWQIECPGCGESHVLTGWQFNGDLDKPTFSPSLLHSSGHYVEGRAHPETCWCTYNAEQREKGEPEAPFACHRCHSFIRDGKIEFLNDSTHELAGQTVDLPEMKAGE